MQVRSMLAYSFLIFAAGLLPHFINAQNMGLERPSSVVIVELFTSEGCSSCPPADALLRQINLKQTNAGQLMVGISEHVTYWNDLGWKDPFSSAEFTDRQNVYASRLSPEGPYTPQMVVNGREQFVGGDADALQKALRDEAQRTHLDVTILSSRLSSSGLDVKFSVAGETARPLDIIAVVTDDADRSNVLRGEKRWAAASARLSGAFAGARRHDQGRCATICSHRAPRRTATRRWFQSSPDSVRSGATSGHN